MVVFITGCSSGIGLELVKIFLNHNWIVIATMRNIKKFPIELKKKNLHVLYLDLEDNLSIKKTIEFVKKKYSTIDIIINNAGYGQFGIFESSKEKDWRKQIEVNFFGPLKITKEFLPIMRKQKKGVIIFVSSIISENAIPLGSLYCASKFALNGFVDSLQYELQPLGISLKLILPGAVKSKFWMNAKRSKSIFQEYTNSFKITKLQTNQFSTSAKTVARRIYKISISKKKKLYHYVTLDAKIVKIMSALTYDLIKRKIIKRFYSKE